MKEECGEIHVFAKKQQQKYQGRCCFARSAFWPPDAPEEYPQNIVCVTRL